MAGCSRIKQTKSNFSFISAYYNEQMRDPDNLFLKESLQFNHMFDSPIYLKYHLRIGMLKIIPLASCFYIDIS